MDREGNEPQDLASAAIYIYAVARQKADGQAVPLAVEGVEPQSTVYALTLPASSPQVGRTRVRAFVSAVPLVEFQPDALKAHLADQTWVRNRALAHQRVLAALLADYTVLPLQFCTLYTSEARVLEMVAANYDHLGAALDHLAGATEWGVKIFCDRAALVDWATRSSDELRPMRETISHMSEGASYMLHKRLVVAARQLAESLERSHAQESHHRLSRVARAAVSHPPQTQAMHGQPDEMILNGAYLVDDRAQQRFEAELARLREEGAVMGCRCELTGPWPPYSFATIEENS